MKDTYDLEGYYCLIVAILMGVNAKEARILFRHGLNNPVSQKILKKKHLRSVRTTTRKERKENIRKMKKEGYSVGMIADFLNCDESTVMRNAKEEKEVLL